jgi:hypothetical protein
MLSKIKTVPNAISVQNVNKNTKRTSIKQKKAIINFLIPLNLLIINDLTMNE